MMTGFVPISGEIILRPDKNEYGGENNYWGNGPW
jgi:hypothetical protein